MKKYPHIKKNPKDEGEWFVVLADLARYLRAPGNCPWDRERTASDFGGFLRNEAEELIEAFEEEDNDHIEEEFGDCLFTLLACGAAAEEEGRFRMERALERIHEKMIRRHDHVFGESRAQTAQEALEAWNRVKAEERKGEQ